jgi:hypothetical protein
MNEKFFYALLGAFTVTVVLFLILFGYDQAREDISQACMDHNSFVFEGTRYDCNIHTVP